VENTCETSQNERCSNGDNPEIIFHSPAQLSGKNVNAQRSQFSRAVRYIKRPCSQQSLSNHLDQSPFFRALALGLIEDIFLLFFVVKTMIPKQGFNLPLSALQWKITTKG
jgi:hypothetical protein